MTDELERWADQLRRLVDELRAVDLGYPQGTNEVRPPAGQLAGLPAALASLYRVSDGVSLPDVHVGYFIDPARRAAGAAVRGEPTRLAGAGPALPVHVFGSDGGGGRFALGADDGAVYYLPSSGAVTDGAYIQDAASIARKVAGSLVEFLQCLERDVEAFVHGEPDGHRYLVS